MPLLEAIRSIEIAFETRNYPTARQLLDEYVDKFPGADGYSALHDLYVDYSQDNLTPRPAILLLDMLTVYRKRGVLR